MWRSIFPEFVRGRGAIGLLILRLTVGAAFVFHGWYKITGDGGMTGWMHSTDVPGFMQAAAALSEFVGGIGLILGLLTPAATFFLACTMIVAIGMAHLSQGQPFVSPKPSSPSWELPAGYLAAVLAVLLAGPGRLSLDYLIFRRGLSGASGPKPRPRPRDFSTLREIYL